jgi:putative DNA methylase
MKRFIEESFPVKEVSFESSKEKNIRHGHISTLHIWWARRPLASSRATGYAALIPAPENTDEWQKKRNFIIDFSKWENSLNETMIGQARNEILKAYNGKPPKILDPFGGGGSIPLEALRLGCETYSNDYNPVAVLIQKCTLEYPQKYGKPGEIEVNIEDEEGLFKEKQKQRIKVKNRLLEDVKKWGNWVLEEAKKELGKFYPDDEDGSIPVGYIWARTIPCQNPSCGAEIPLMRQYWLAKKAKKNISLYPYVKNGKVSFKIVGDGYEKMPEDFYPSKGTIARAVATCPVCGSTVDANSTRKLFKEGKSGERMVAVVLYKPGVKGKRYRIAEEKDVAVFNKAALYCEEKRLRLKEEWGMEPVPDEGIPPKNSHRAVGSQLPLYNFSNWGDLFNPRQKLALITFADIVRRAYREMTEKGYEEEYAKAIIGYLGLTLDMNAAFNNSLARWENTSEAIKQLYARQALPMLWDYVETNLFSNATGSYNAGRKYYFKVIERFCKINNKTNSKISQSSATYLPYKENFFDAVLTDPPYYDNVPYSYLSDFFYVWLKRILGDLYPELFSTPLSPKKNEIVVYSNIPGGFDSGKQFFENMLKKSFQEIHRVLKPEGIAVIVYAHKSTSGWETLINSLLDSGLVITGAWPINTEMQSRLNAKETAALASSIYIIARKMKRTQTGFYHEVKEKLEKHLNKKLERLWREGISGADFFIAAIGSAIEIFGQYEKVMDYEGNTIRADRMLEDVRKISTDYAVRQILHLPASRQAGNGFSGEISDLTRFYILYRWNYGPLKVAFDEARKLAQGFNVDLSKEWSRHGFIKKEKEFIKVLGPHERKIDELKNKDEMIDVLHLALLLWEKGKREEMKRLLSEKGYGKNEAFYRAAQAISETLTVENKEKKLLDGFLSGRQKLQEEMNERRLM